LSALQSTDIFDEKGSEQALRPVALDRFADLFARDECDAVFGAFAVKEDEPRGVPDFVGTAVDAVELTLLRDAFETA